MKSKASIPEKYVCPILREIMTNPVLASDGYTYEKESILNWIERGNKNSPINGDHLLNIILPNNFAKYVIEEYLTNNPEIGEIVKDGEKNNLEECILQKEEVIKSLTENKDNFENEMARPGSNILLEIGKEKEEYKKKSERLAEELTRITEANKKLLDEIDLLKKKKKRSSKQIR